MGQLYSSKESMLIMGVPGSDECSSEKVDKPDWRAGIGEKYHQCFPVKRKKRSGRDSNPRPPAWQAGVLTNWTTGPIVSLCHLSDYAVITSFRNPFSYQVDLRALRFWLEKKIHKTNRQIQRTIKILTRGRKINSCVNNFDFLEGSTVGSTKSNRNYFH